MVRRGKEGVRLTNGSGTFRTHRKHVAGKRGNRAIRGKRERYRRVSRLNWGSEG